jgi:hypothetical protein
VRQARRFVRAVGKQLLASDSLRLGLDRSTFRVQAVALLKSAESNGNNATTWLPEGGARFELSNKAAHYAKRLWHAYVIQHAHTHTHTHARARAHTCARTFTHLLSCARRRYEKRTEAALRKREAEHGAASPARRSRTAASASAGATTGTALGDLDSLSALDEARCERVWRAAGEAHGKTREELRTSAQARARVSRSAVLTVWRSSWRFSHTVTALVRLPNRRVEWVAAYVDEAFPIVAHSDAIVPAQAAHLVFGVGAVEPLATLRDIVLARALRVIAAARGGLGHDSVCATLLPQLLAALASLADGIAQRAGRAVVKRLALVRVAALTACAAAGCAAGPSAVDRAAPVLQLLLGACRVAKPPSV